MTNEYIKLGTIIKTKGIKGEMVLFDVPKAVKDIRKGAIVKAGYSLNFSEDYILEKYGEYQKGGLIRLEEIENEIEGKELKEKGVFAHKNDINRKEKEYIDHELIGCEVYDQKNNELLGEIINVLELPANDVWIIIADGTEIPIPAIDDVIREVDIDNKKITIEVLEGLLDLGDQKSE